jgi:hypothetical protein
MNAFFTGGALFALIAVGMLVELVALSSYYQRTGRGIPARLLVGDIGAGLCILLAALAALRGAGWVFVATSLLAALGCHIFDLRQRWRR